MANTKRDTRGRFALNAKQADVVEHVSKSSIEVIIELEESLDVLQVEASTLQVGLKTGKSSIAVVHRKVARRAEGLSGRLNSAVEQVRKITTKLKDARESLGV